jgi:hypothetical protein
VGGSEKPTEKKQQKKEEEEIKELLCGSSERFFYIIQFPLAFLFCVSYLNIWMTMTIYLTQLPPVSFLFRCLFTFV